MRISGTMSSAGSGPPSFIRIKAKEAVQNTVEHFILPSADKLYGDAGFIFHQGATLPKVPISVLVTMVTPAIWPDLSSMENHWAVVKRKKRDTKTNDADTPKADIKVQSELVHVTLH